MASNPGFKTPEDLELHRIDKLACRLREKPLLPPMPHDAKTSWTDVSSGIKFPKAHCAFKGCAWVGASSDSIYEHIRSAHGQEIDELCDLTTETAKTQRRDYYEAAIAEVERGSVPLVGPSIDRRTFAHTVEVYNSKSVETLVCICCAQKKVCLGGERAGSAGQFYASVIDWKGGLYLIVLA